MATRTNSLALRLALPIAMIGMTAVGVAGPARAEPAAERPTIEISVPERVATAGSTAKTVPFEVANAGETPATGLVVDFAFTGTAVDPHLGFKPPQGCTATGCPVGDLAPGARKTLTFTVAPTAELPATGASIGLVVHDAGGEWKKSAGVTVVREPSGVDLETAPIPDIALAAGKSAVLPISVRNNGNQPTEGVGLALTGQRYITFPSIYSNCVEIKELPGVVCVFDLTLAPGATFSMSPSTPLTIAADPATPAPADYTAGVAALSLDDEANDAGLAAATRAARKPGAKLQLVPAARSLAVVGDELNEWDNATSFLVKVSKNPADSVAIGDDFEGKIGDTRTVQVGFRNDGPATVLPRSASWIHAAKVRIPSGLKLTKVDKNCVPNGDGEPSWNSPGQVSGHDYLCVATKPLAAGERQLFSFTAEIEDGENEDEGTITVDGGVQDPKTTNNVAKIEVKLTTGGGSGAGSSGGSGGGLPITGAPAGRTAGAGMLLVLAGALALVLTRRRRPA